MKEHPMPFSGPMVRAILGGQKTQTRRIPTMTNSTIDGDTWIKRIGEQLDWSNAWVDCGRTPAGKCGPYFRVPAFSGETVHRVYCRYSVGDRLWVKETWGEFRRRPGVPVYKADDPFALGSSNPWRPSIHMPRWASRIILEITDIRGQRVQDITEEDAWQEGATRLPDGTLAGHYLSLQNDASPCCVREWFSYLWDAINAKRGFSWESNPWVWAFTFKKVG